MTNSTKKAKRPGKASAEPDKVLKILAEARQVVDDLGGKTAAPPRKKKPAAQEKESPRSRSTPGTARKPASRKKPAATAKATSSRKPAPSPTKAKKAATAAPKPAATLKPASAPPSPPLLSPRDCGIQVAHSLPGRIRFRIKSLQFDDDLARDMATKLSAIDGIAEAGASPSTGSLLISYYSKERVAVPLGKALKTWFPRLDTDSLLAEMLD